MSYSTNTGFTIRNKPDIKLVINANANGEISPGDMFEFSGRKLKLLFVKGKASEKDNSEIKISSSNLGKIPPVLGSAMSVKMTRVLSM